MRSAQISTLAWFTASQKRSFCPSLFFGETVNVINGGKHRRQFKAIEATDYAVRRSASQTPVPPNHAHVSGETTARSREIDSAARLASVEPFVRPRARLPIWSIQASFGTPRGSRPNSARRVFSSSSQTIYACPLCSPHSPKPTSPLQTHQTNIFNNGRSSRVYDHRW